MKWFFLSGLALLLATQTSTAQSKETGLAGMYSDAFHGRVTASGSKYNKDEFTGAHKTLPFGTRVKVTMAEGGGSTVVEITDRGPYDQGRIIDLSRAAATEIGLDKKGYAQVRLEVVDKNTALGTKTTGLTASNTTPQPEVKPEVKPAATETKTTVTAPVKTETKPAATTTITKTETKPATTTTPTKTETKPAANTTTIAKTETKPAATTTPSKTETKPAATTSTIAKTETKPTVAKTETKTPVATTTGTTKSTESKPKEAAKIEAGGLYKMQVLEMPKEGYGVQVGGFSEYQAATEKVSELQKQWFKGAMVYVGQRNSAPYYRVILGPFFTKDEANSYNESLKSKYKIKDAFVVDLKTLDAE